MAQLSAAGATGICACSDAYNHTVNVWISQYCQILMSECHPGVHCCFSESLFKISRLGSA